VHIFRYSIRIELGRIRDVKKIVGQDSRFRDILYGTLSKKI
jgi:hypothetical protein